MGKQRYKDTRRGISKAQWNKQFGSIIFTEIFWGSVILGLIFSSWGIFGLSLIGLSLIYMVKELAQILVILISLAWAVVIGAIGTLLGGAVAGLIFAIIAFAVSLTWHQWSLEYVYDVIYEGEEPLTLSPVFSRIKLWFLESKIQALKSKQDIMSYTVDHDKDISAVDIKCTFCGKNFTSDFNTKELLSKVQSMDFFVVTCPHCGVQISVSPRPGSKEDITTSDNKKGTTVGYQVKILDPEVISYVIKDIIENKDFVFRSDKLREGLEDYLFIKEKFDKGESRDEEFRERYVDFYKMDYARVSDVFKKKYFELLEIKPTNIKNILWELYNAEDQERGEGKVHISFSSKLIHTVDNNRPILDRNVNKMLGVRRPTIKNVDKKIDEWVRIYSEVESIYTKILENAAIRDVIKEFRNKFSMEKERISDVKILDFFMWILGSRKTPRMFFGQSKSSEVDKTLLIPKGSILPLSGRGNPISWEKNKGGKDVVWGGCKFNLPDSMIDNILKNYFRNSFKWYPLGASTTSPVEGGLGEYIVNNFPTFTSRHASAIAAIMVHDKLLEFRGMKPIELKKR